VSDQFPFGPSGIATALDQEAVFGARNPSLLVRTERHVISFRHGEYRTSDPTEIELLLKVVADEARGNRGVWVRQLPRSSEESDTAIATRAKRAKEAKRKARPKGAEGEGEDALESE